MAKVKFWNVNTRGITLDTIIALSAIYDLPVVGILWITEVVAHDGHSEGSEHYEGDAIDFVIQRDGDVLTAQNKKAVQLLRNGNKLPQGYDVIHEDIGGENEHVHVEYDPKRGELA